MKKSIKNIEFMKKMRDPFLLFFIAFELFFQKNSNLDFSFLNSIDNIIFSFLIFILYIISKKVNEISKFILLFIYLLIFFTFFNSLIEQTLFLLQNSKKGRITYLHVLVFYLIILLLSVFFLKKDFLNEILFKYYIISIFYFGTSILIEKTIPINTTKNFKFKSVDIAKSSVKKSTLLIILDEYSPFTEIKNITVNPKDRILEDFLTEKKFFTSTIKTSEASVSTPFLLHVKS